MSIILYVSNYKETLKPAYEKFMQNQKIKPKLILHHMLNEKDAL